MFSFFFFVLFSSSCVLIYLLNKKVWDFRAIAFSFQLIAKR